MVPVLMSYMEKIPYFANIKVHEEGYNIVLHYNMSSKDALFLAEELNKKREN